MGMSQAAGSEGAMKDINVTPVIDVMLVLLIIFMAVSYTHLTLPTVSSL